MKHYAILMLAMLILCVACKKNDHGSNIDPGPNPNFHPDHFIFGSDQNPCAPCDLVTIVYYMVNDQKLYSEQTSNLFSTANMMADSNYQKAQLLINQFPAYFLSHPNSSIGCNSCGAFKTIDITAITGTDTIKWTIDTTIGTLPSEIQPYMSQFISTWKGL